MSLSLKFLAQQAYQRFQSKLLWPDIDFLEKKLCIACSGGVDSIFLTLILAGKFSTKQLVILHYNHTTRGVENEDDELFVREFAQNLGIAFLTEKRKDIPYTEASLRESRYQFFRKIMRQFDTPYLFTAHHANDVIETMLMRLARGSSEIAAPKMFQKFPDHIRIRPLLNIPKRDIITFLTEHQISWREDPSNRNDHYLRNRIRKTLVSFDRVIGKQNWETNFLSSYHYLCEDADCLQQMATAYVHDPKRLDLRSAKFSALIRRAIHLWYPEALSKTCFEEIFSAILKNETKTLTVTPTLSIKIDHKILTKIITPKACPPYHFANWSTGTLFLPNGFYLSRTFHRMNKDDSEGIFTNPKKFLQDDNRELLNQNVVFLNPEIAKTVSIRTWENGDAYRPIHAPQKSLKKLFCEKKIPAPLRRQLPVLCDVQGNILWVPGLPLADHAKIHGNFALKITFSSTAANFSLHSPTQ